MPPAIRLSKSRYMAGLQCPKMLWWRVHEPDAPELQTGPEQQAVFDAGNHVGEVAREHVPGGVLVDFQHYQVSEKIAATAEALAQGARVVYEASFMADDIFVSVDILERKRGGFVLSEVKGTLRGALNPCYAIISPSFSTHRLPGPRGA
mgnify:CR=1 FL=1